MKVTFFSGIRRVTSQMLKIFLLIPILSQWSVTKSNGVFYGIISNASLVISGSNSIFLTNVDCDTCSCAIYSNSSYFSFNCFQENKTCQMYSTSDQSKPFSMIGSSSTRFYFSSLPVFVTTVSTNFTYACVRTSNNSSTTSSLTNDTEYLWTFDSTYNDQSSTFVGRPINNATFSSLSLTGDGSSLSLSSVLFQYVLISSPVLNFANQSWTVEAWIYLTNVSSGTDYGIMGQCAVRSTNQCLFLMIRTQKLYFAFYGNDLIGTTVLQPSTWYHVAYVFDCLSGNRSLYLNGRIDANDRSSSCFQGRTGILTIGVTDLSPYRMAFAGVIDQLDYINRSRTADELLDAATLTIYLSFDNDSNCDQGPLLLNGSRRGQTNFTDGRVGSNSLQISNINYSYYLVEDLTLLGVQGQAFSFSIWIRPDQAQQSSILHVSSASNGNSSWCLSFLGITNAGRLAAYSWSNNIIEVMGPIVPLYNWTHVAMTYSNSSGLRLYVNGTLYNSSASFWYTASTTTNYLLVGSPYIGMSCRSLFQVNGQYSGAIDELRLYSRELSASNIHTLASP